MRKVKGIVYHKNLNDFILTNQSVQPQKNESIYVNISTVFIQGVQNKIGFNWLHRKESHTGLEHHESV